MSDLEKICHMLNARSIGYTVEGNTLTVERGYTGFVTIFSFDDIGTFMDIGAFE